MVREGRLEVGSEIVGARFSRKQIEFKNEINFYLVCRPSKSGLLVEKAQVQLDIKASLVE